MRYPKQYDDEFLNIIKQLIDLATQTGRSVQDLVAEGQLTPTQYSELIKTVNGLISKGEVKSDDLSPELLEIINNGDGTPFEILSIPRDGSVSEEKTTFINLSTNLLIEATLSKNKVIDPNNGELINGARHTSDFIKVEPGSHITTSFGEGYATYESDKNFISFGSIAGSENGVTRLLNGQTHYIRVEIYPSGLGKAQINIGETLLPYEQGYKRLSEDIEINYEIGEGEVKNENIAEKAVGIENTDFIEFSSNLIDKNDLIPSTTIDGNTGAVIANNNHSTTRHIRVMPNTTYSFVGVGRIAEYAKNGNFLRSIPYSGDALTVGSRLTTMADTESVILVLHKDYINVAQANVGEVLLPYEPGHKPRLSDEIEVLGTQSEDKKLDIKNDDYFVDDVLTENYYKQTEPLPAREVGRNGGGKDSIDVNEMFDKFITEHPEYVKKEQIALSSADNHPILLYDFNPDIVGIPSPETKFPEIFIVAGIHGTEKMASEITRRAFEQIYNNWENDKVLEYLRWNIRFKIIPMLNPDGWNNSTRQNANGVDLNRQFPDDWVMGTEGSSTYGGQAPLTEPESIAVNKILEGNPNFIYVCDFHNFSSGDYNFIWNAGGTVFNNNLAKTLISKTRREWIKEYDWYEDGDDGVRGYASWTPGGSLARRASALGMQSSTYEFTMGHDLDPSEENYSSNIMTLGTEAFINWLYLNAKNNIDL